MERVDGVNWCAGIWMPIQRTQRRWINAKQVQEQTDNVLCCVKPVPTDLSQYFRLVTPLSYHRSVVGGKLRWLSSIAAAFQNDLDVLERDGEHRVVI